MRIGGTITKNKLERALSVDFVMVLRFASSKDVDLMP